MIHRISIGTVPVVEKREFIEIESAERILSVLVQQRGQTPKGIVLRHLHPQHGGNEPHSLSVPDVLVVFVHRIQYIAQSLFARTQRVIL